MNNNNNNVFYLKNHKVYNTLCPEKIVITLIQAGQKSTDKGVIKLHKNDGKENKYNNTQKEKPYTQTRAQGFCCQKKRLKLQLKVYTTYQVKFLKHSFKYVAFK